MPIHLIAPLAAAAKTYSRATLVTLGVTTGVAMGTTGGFLGWLFTRNDKANDDKKKLDDLAKKRIDEVKEDLGQIESHIKDLKLKIPDFNDKMKEYVFELQENKNLLVDNQNVLTEQSRELEKYLQQIELLQSKLNEAQKTRTEKDGEILKTKNALNRLEETVKSQIRTMEFMTAQVNELKQANEAWEKKYDNYKHMVEEKITPKIGDLIQKIGIYKNQQGVLPPTNTNVLSNQYPAL